MACVVLLEINVKDEAIEGIKSGLGGMFPDTRAYEGNIDIYATQDQDNPNTIVMVEKWESRQHYEKYFAWRTERGDIDALGEALASPPSIRYMDILDA
ncbi:MAG: antibiotic biosynthesis monooxygenase [Pseudomonadota bacterium]